MSEIRELANKLYGEWIDSAYDDEPYEYFLEKKILTMQKEVEELREGLKYLSERLEETEHDNLVLYIRNLNNNRNE